MDTPLLSLNKFTEETVITNSSTHYNNLIRNESQDVAVFSNFRHPLPLSLVCFRMFCRLVAIDFITFLLRL